jgi:hypothetical protein
MVTVDLQNKYNILLSENTLLMKRVKYLEMNGASNDINSNISIKDKVESKLDLELFSRLMGLYKNPILNRLIMPILIRRLRRSKVFDENYYITKYPDVKRSGLKPEKHFLLYGFNEGRYPNCDW